MALTRGGMSKSLNKVRNNRLIGWWKVVSGKLMHIDPAALPVAFAGQTLWMIAFAERALLIDPAHKKVKIHRIIGVGMTHGPEFSLNDEIQTDFLSRLPQGTGLKILTPPSLPSRKFPVSSETIPLPSPGYEKSPAVPDHAHADVSGPFPRRICRYTFSRHSTRTDDRGIHPVCLRPNSMEYQSPTFRRIFTMVPSCRRKALVSTSEGP